MKKKNYNELQKEYAKLARQVKKQIQEIKKAGYKKSPAENVLIGRLPSAAIGKRDNVLIKPKKRSKEVFEKGIIELQKFLKFKTSTKEGYEQLLQERREAFKKNYGEVESLSNNEIDELLDFLGSEKGKSSKDMFDSDQTILMLTKAKIKNKNKKIADIYNDFLESGKTIADELRKLEKQSKNDFIKL